MLQETLPFILCYIGHGQTLILIPRDELHWHSVSDSTADIKKVEDGEERWSEGEKESKRKGRRGMKEQERERERGRQRERERAICTFCFRSINSMSGPGLY